jgi:hypothetical protein
VKDRVLPQVDQYNPGPGPLGAGIGEEEKRRESGGYAQNQREEDLPTSPTLRYPDPDENIREELPSGNVGRGHY